MKREKGKGMQINFEIRSDHLDSLGFFGAKREKGKGMVIIFEIRSDLVYSSARTHERNETISRLVSLPPTSDNLKVEI